MKKLLPILLFVISVSCSAQKKDTVKVWLIVQDHKLPYNSNPFRIRGYILRDTVFPYKNEVRPGMNIQILKVYK